MAAPLAAAAAAADAKATASLTIMLGTAAKGRCPILNDAHLRPIIPRCRGWRHFVAARSQFGRLLRALLLLQKLVAGLP